MIDNSQFKKLKFKFPFRKHQEMILDKFNQIFNNEDRRYSKFHVVSPPGSGKTIAGIEMAIRLGFPAMIMCPNTAIQGQWMDKVRMFIPEESDIDIDTLVSADPKNIRLFNVFTYQALSIPDNGNDSMTRLAENIWADYLSESTGVAVEEALDRIYKMKQSNPQAYAKELAKFNKKIRIDYLEDVNADLFRVLHPNARELVNNLYRHQVKTVIFDECHHLQNYWALVMSEIIRKLQAQNVIGLTATPPLDEEVEQVKCYARLMGGIDFEIPTPAVVKEGMLAPYQDLVYFCIPTTDEFEFIKNSHQKFKELTLLFNKPEGDFYYWIIERIVNRKLVTGETQEWAKFISSRPGLATAGVKYLLKHNYRLPRDVKVTEIMYEQITLEDWCFLIEDYALNLLKISAKEEDAKLYDDIRDALRSLGFVLSEKGIRTYSSPIDRVLAYSRSKISAVKTILKNEMESMGENLRIAIVTDFEFSNALSIKRTDNVINEESGGAISVIRELTADPDLDRLNPVMVTSSNLLCDDDLAETYISMGRKWAIEQSLVIDFSIEPTDAGNFSAIIGSGKDWNSRTAVLFTTNLLEQGVTKCIIGTRGLLGEGWDSIKLNTLIDLTTVTTYASVNQLRGRSIRKSPDEPKKLANNWDVICIAPGFEKGYNDADRLYKRHGQFYGICDDGQIQRGINHLDGALAFGESQLSDTEISLINQRMLNKAADRETAYKLWRIGEKYENQELGCCELKIAKPIKMKAASVFKNETIVLRGKIKACILWTAFTGVCSYLASQVYTYDTNASYLLWAVAGVFGIGTYWSIRALLNFANNNFFGLSVRNSVEDICKCVFHSLKECELINSGSNEKSIVVSERGDGSIRVYIDGVEEDTKLFANSVAEVFAPIEDQRYAVQRYEVAVPNGAIGRLLYIIRYGFNRCDPVLMCYHPLSNVFGSKDRALVFQKYWNKYVSPGEVVYLKGDRGLKIMESYGRINYMGVSKQADTVWK